MADGNPRGLSDIKRAHPAPSPFVANHIADVRIVSLINDLTISTKPLEPNTRFTPAIGLIRETFGWRLPRCSRKLVCTRTAAPPANIAAISEGTIALITANADT